jgi:tetratricopeptide (TPR) repeat protein
MEELKAAIESGAHEKAVVLAEALLRDHKDRVDKLLKIARLCRAGGLVSHALSALDAALEAAGRQGGALRKYYLAIAAERYRSGHYAEALQTIDQALAVIAPHADLYEFRGRVLRAMNDILGAVQALEKGLELLPNDANLTETLSRYLLVQAKYEVPGSVPSQQKFERVEALLVPALDDMRQAGTADGKQCQALLNLLVDSLLNQFKFQEAYDWLQVFSSSLGSTDTHLRLVGYTLYHWGRYDEAERLYREALSVNGANRAALFELAEILEMLGSHAEAERLHERLIETNGDRASNARSHSYTILAQGRTREGWKRHMDRLEATALANLAGVRVWDGSSLSGRSIFVIAEGGTGDELRDAACYKEVSEAAGRCTISCDPRLEPLFARSFPAADFVPLKRMPRVSSGEKMLSKLLDDQTRQRLEEYDFCVLGPDLFYHLKPSADHYGIVNSFLVPDEDLRRMWRERLAHLGSGPKIGITWRSGTKLYRIDRHYTRLQDWGPIFGVPGLHFVNLQYDECEKELAEVEQTFGIPIHRWTGTNLKDDFESVAALSRELNLILAPNTTNLELAGAVGTRAWYLLNKPQAYDYWRLKKRDTGEDRLYPSVRLITGDRVDDPASLISRVAQELRSTFSLARQNHDLGAAAM